MPALHFSRPSARDQMKAQTLHAINAVMSSVAGDTATLLAVVAGGPMCWRNRFLGACKGLAIDARIADSVFAFFCEQVRRRFGHELSAGQVLDALDVPSPLSQREIDDAWTVDSASSEEGRRFFYGPDGHPEEIIKKLVH